jgi:pyridoxine 5-phosphate synthase
MTKLSVNINKIALLRNSRGGKAPDLLEFGELALQAGADGLTVHPRADERHITRNDALAVAKRFGAQTEVNFEGDLREDFLDLVLSCKPHQCTLVPVSPGEVTSHRGWDFDRYGFVLAPVISHLKAAGIRVSVFVNPEPGSAQKAAAVGADRIEIYTEPYACDHAKGGHEALDHIVALVEEAKRFNVGVNAGHDLTVENLGPLLRAAPSIREVSIGHHLVSRALQFGFVPTVAAFKEICKNKTNQKF